jgi:hypothetical protein
MTELAARQQTLGIMLDVYTGRSWVVQAMPKMQKHAFIRADVSYCTVPPLRCSVCAFDARGPPQSARFDIDVCASVELRLLYLAADKQVLFVYVRCSLV